MSMAFGSCPDIKATYSFASYQQMNWTEVGHKGK